MGPTSSHFSKGGRGGDLLQHFTCLSMRRCVDALNRRTDEHECTASDTATTLAYFNRIRSPYFVIGSTTLATPSTVGLLDICGNGICILPLGSVRPWRMDGPPFFSLFIFIIPIKFLICLAQAFNWRHWSISPISYRLALKSTKHRTAYFSWARHHCQFTTDKTHGSFGPAGSFLLISHLGVNFG